MKDDFEHMVYTKYKNEKGAVTSIPLSKTHCDLIKEKVVGSRTRWIQEQHDQIIAEYRKMHGITAAVTGYPRDKIHVHIVVKIMELYGDNEDF